MFFFFFFDWKKIVYRWQHSISWWTDRIPDRPLVDSSCSCLSAFPQVKRVLGPERAKMGRCWGLVKIIRKILKDIAFSKVNERMLWGKIFLTFCLFREVFQLCISAARYFHSPENIIEVQGAQNQNLLQDALIPYQPDQLNPLLNSSWI